MRILVLGWSWFVWKNLVEKLLYLNIELVVVDKENLNIYDNNLIFYKQDLLERDLISLLGSTNFDFVINCIWRQYVDTKIPYFNIENFFDEINVDITRQSLDFCLINKINNYIYISSDMVYWIPIYSPIDEKHPCNPIWFYGLSKLKAENLINTYSKNHLINSLIIRPRLIIWKWRWWVVNILIKLFKYNLPVPFFWSWSNRYQMINVDDLTDFIIYSMNNNIFWVLNIGSKKISTFIEIYYKIKNITKSKSIIFRTNHNINKLLFKFFSFFWLNILFKEQYSIADIDFVLDISLINKYWWEPKKSDLESILEIIKK